MIRSNASLLALALFLSLGTLASASKKCMLIGAAEGEENAEYDKHIIPQLEAWGYTVDKHLSSDLPSYTEKDYAPYDFIFLSETTHSSKMAPLSGIPKPMLSSDGWGAKESALAFGTGEPVGILEPAQPIVFLEGATGHPLAADYKAGTVIELGTVEERSDPCLIIWGKPTIPITAIAGVESDPSQLIVYGIEKGTTNALGESIPHRVAVIGYHAWGYDVITEDGAKLFKAGIEWVLAEN